MKVIYGKNIYELETDLDCQFFSSLQEEGIQEIELYMFEHIFLRLLNKPTEMENVFYFLGNDYTFKSMEETYKGLLYFGSKYINEFVYEVYLYIKNKELETFQKVHDNFFASYTRKLGDIKNNRAFSLEFRKQKHTFDQYDLEANTDKNYFKDNIYIRYDEIQKVPFEIVQKRFEEFKNDNYLWENKYIPDWFIEKHISSIDIETLAQFGKKSFIEKNMHLFSGFIFDIILGYNKNLDIDFLKKYNITPRENWNRRIWSDKLSKTEKGKSICITYDYVQKNPDKVDWWFLSQNDFDLDFRLYNKIKNTKYFDLDQLEHNFKIFNVN